MKNKIFTKALFVLFCSVHFFSLNAQKVKEPKAGNPEWEQPYQPFCIVGNLYYVGTYDLACYLITTPEGNILINTGLKSSLSQIEQNIETLGFRLNDTKILLNTQAHYDHLGAMADIKKKTGATFMANAPEQEALLSGGMADYALGGNGSTFKPIKPDRLLQNLDTIKLGGMQLVLLHHPGHTKGSCSYLFDVKDSQRTYKVLIANMPSIVTEKRFDELSSYPTISQDYASTLKAMKSITFDLWLSSHASQFSLHKKHQPNDLYNPLAFADQSGYIEALTKFQAYYDEKITKDSLK